MDEEICTLERACPGPRLATTEAWIDHLESYDSDPGNSDELLGGNVLPFDDDKIEQIEANSKDDQQQKDHDDVVKVRRVCLYKKKFKIFIQFF